MPKGSGTPSTEPGEARSAPNALQAARQAYEQHAWREAVHAFEAAERESALAAHDLEQLAEAQWWAGDPEAASDVYERAFTRYSGEGRHREAARAALQLAYFAFRRLAAPVMAAWLARAEQLLGTDAETGTHAWLELFRSVSSLEEGRPDEAVHHADRALELARRHEERDAAALAQSMKGLANVSRGRLREGIGLIDASAAAAMAGDLDLRNASDIWCNTILACRRAGDLRRAGDWADEAERWMRREGVGGYPGICQVHRAELKMLRGKWQEAEREARRACEELERHGLMDVVGFAHYEIGEVRLRMGDVGVAADALDRAYEFGHDAQPASALVMLATGESDEAARTLERALLGRADAAGSTDLADRARLLPAQVEIALARGDAETAEAATTELERIATVFDRPLFAAAALTTRGALSLDRDDAAAAIPVLGRAWRTWRQADLPYESARARLLYAQALAADGDVTASRRDLRAARSAFHRLGAMRDVRRVDELLGDGRDAAGQAGLRAHRSFMFTDIVSSTDLVGLIGDEAWEDLLRWHDRELRSLFRGHRGEEVDHTGDGFFVAFEVASDAVECAVDIQRRLSRHRREHGFAPWVRIGIHVSEATRHEDNYSGQGVHVAARIGAAAGREQILASQAVVDAVESSRLPVSGSTSLTLKGVRDTVTVREVYWRESSQDRQPRGDSDP